MHRKWKKNIGRERKRKRAGTKEEEDEEGIHLSIVCTEWKIRRKTAWGGGPAGRVLLFHIEVWTASRLQSPKKCFALTSG